MPSQPSLPPRPHLADFRTNRRVLLLCAMAVAAGGISTVAAYVLVWLINRITNLAFYLRWSGAEAAPDGHAYGPWVIVVPVIGALIIGFMARHGSEKIRGHGIPEALEAILLGRSRVQLKVALLKPLSAAISIGTGGPFGAEGPIIMTGGAFGSLFAQGFRLSSVERKTLLVAGAAAGMAAVFATPVGAVLLAVELLLFEWKPRSFIPVVVAALTASALRVPLLGTGPVFAVAPHGPVSGAELACAGGVGLLAGFAAGAVTWLLYGFEDLFRRLPFHWSWWPAIGALGVGIGGLIEPRVLGVGYEVIHGMLRGEMIGMAVLGLVVAKAVVWSVALGSGTSGGVLAPLLMMGAALGALASPWVPAGDAAMWATVGMAAMMGGTMRAPLTSVVFAVELTRDFQLLPALLAGSVAAVLVAVLLMRRSILTEKLARRGHHITHEYSIDPFEWMRVSEVMDKSPPTIPATMTVRELAGRIAAGEAKLTRHQALCIVDEKDELAGIITRGDIVRALAQDNADESRAVLEAGGTGLLVAFPDEPLHDALARMLNHDIGRLPVVSSAAPRRLIGYLGRAQILSARQRLDDDENVKQRGWQSSPAATAAPRPPAHHHP